MFPFTTYVWMLKNFTCFGLPIFKRWKNVRPPANDSTF
jgi:hypothetical protein